MKFYPYLLFYIYIFGENRNKLLIYKRESVELNSKDKDKMINEIIYTLKEKLDKDYKKGNFKRGAHPKNLGLLKAYFKVDDNLDEELITSLIKPGIRYPCLIRFSSGGNKVKSDKSKDIRGMSIKVLGVKGKRFKNDEKNTNDFIMLTIPTMPIGTLSLFRDSIKYMVKKKNPIAYMCILIKKKKLHIVKDLMKYRKNQTSPLDVSYFSTTPYAYGNKVVKFSVVPKSTYKSEMPNRLEYNYLTNNMQSHLMNHEAKFDFLIQIRNDEKDMPINDASVQWNENKSPFIKIGEISIPKQNFINKKRNYLSENLSFSPGNSVIDHKPLGDINLARVRIYSELSKFRHYKNKNKLVEPTIEDFNKLK